ncbi:unnamed protein product [Heligmosomoides polygyrus]|uniref:GATA-type domain-containing protein n=1 Tax=Heligmosomoides polygyrus TaxID=6339 RepID=A0A183GMF9_HELPZ|nr:unnamed protein product [Heligmosomoides polygyrus]
MQNDHKEVANRRPREDVDRRRSLAQNRCPACRTQTDNGRRTDGQAWNRPVGPAGRRVGREGRQLVMMAG